MSASIQVSRAKAGSADAVKTVLVVSTGTAEIHPEHPYGTKKPLYWWLLTSRQWTPPRPINAYVIGQMPDLVVLPAHDPTAARRLLES